MMSETGTAAVVLAGAKTKGTPSGAGWPEWRALAPVCGRPVLCWVMDALRGSRNVGRIIVVGDACMSPFIGDAKLLPAGPDLWENVASGLRDAGEGLSLLCGADVPLLTPAAVDDVIERGRLLDSDLVYTVVRREDAEAQCPGMRRTWAGLADGTFTGGNLMLVNGARLLANEGIIRCAIAARKKPLQLARLISPWLVVRVLTRRAKVAELEAAVSRILQARAKALVTPFAEVGADLDDPSETPLFEAILRTRTSQDADNSGRQAQL